MQSTETRGRSSSPVPLQGIALALGAVLLALLSGLELGLAIPVSASIYLALALLGVIGAVLLGRRIGFRAALVGAGVFLVVLALLYGLPWTSRKVFLRHLHQVEKGMTLDQVEAIMVDYRGEKGGSREERIRSFRHSTDPRFDSDVAVIRFDDQGRVEQVEFLPD